MLYAKFHGDFNEECNTKKKFLQTEGIYNFQRTTSLHLEHKQQKKLFTFYFVCLQNEVSIDIEQEEEEEQFVVLFSVSV